MKDSQMTFEKDLGFFLLKIPVKIHAIGSERAGVAVLIFQRLPLCPEYRRVPIGICIDLSQQKLPYHK